MNPSANPTTVYVTQQVTATVASLSIIAGTIILAMQGYIHDGEIVTLLMGSVGAHLIIQPNKAASTTATVPVDVAAHAAPAVATPVATTPAPVVETSIPTVVPTTTTFP